MKLEDMKIHSDAVELAVLFRQYYKTFSKDDQFSIGAQMLRSSISIASNIAEGVGRNGSNKALLQFLRYANGSLYEFKTQMQIIQLDYQSPQRTACIDKLNAIEKGLDKFIRFVSKTEEFSA